MSTDATRIVAFFPIDFPHASEHSAWPEAHLAHLGATWRAPEPTEDLALQAYGHDVLDSLLRSMPSAVLEVTGGPSFVDATFAGAAEPADRDALLSPAEGWALVHARVSLWNLGNGLATFTYDLPAGSVAATATRGHVYALAPAVERLVGQLTAWPDSRPVVLWGNPVYLVRVAPGTDDDTRRELSAGLTADGQDCPLQEHPRSLIRLGRHCSVVTDSFDDPAVGLLLRLVGVHQVCWGAALLYDARLGGELELIQPDSPTLSVTTLERQADRILTTYHLVRLFRLRYSSVEAHLDSGASRVWHGLEESWKFTLVLAGLDERLDFVRTFHQQLFARVQDGRSRLLNELVLAFTFLNLFSILLAAMSFAALNALTLKAAAGLAMGFALVVNVVVYLYFRRQLSGRRRRL